MHLYSGEPIWLKYDQPTLRFEALRDEITCDVAIIGAGITGALLADRLTRDGRKVVLVDSRSPGHGSTSASTGLLQYALDVPLHKLIKRVGNARAVYAYRRSLAAIDDLQDLAAGFPEQCRFRRRPSYYLASKWWHVPSVRREFASLKTQGLPVQYVTRQELRRLGVRSGHGAIRSASDGEIDPFRFTQCLLQAAIGRTLSAFSNTRVTEIVEHAEGVSLTTDTSGTVKCGFLVIAAGYEVQALLPLTSVNLQSTYVAVSKPLADPSAWPEQALFWETARPYFYARRTHDGRAIIGGADTAFHDDHERQSLLERKVAKLVRRFRKLFPNIDFEIDGMWAGTFAETKTSLPLIGRRESQSRQFIALGYGGNGITFSVIAARLIADLIAGRVNPDETVFAPFVR